MLKLRISSYCDDIDLFMLILNELQHINAIKIIQQSKPYENRGNSLIKRHYIDLEINPNIINSKLLEFKNDKKNTYL